MVCHVFPGFTFHFTSSLTHVDSCVDVGTTNVIGCNNVDEE
jgi:hypothetical protein